MEVAWQPQAGPQKALVDCPLPVIFMGGARGGGKTDGVLGKWAIKEKRWGKHFNAIMFRKTTVSADDAIERSKEIFGPLGGEWLSTRLTWRMGHGGRMAFKYLETVDNAEEYQGRNLTDAWVEEVGQYADSDAIDRLNAVLRSVHGVPTQLILTGNPGGAGQHWIRERFSLCPLPMQPIAVPMHLPDGSVMMQGVIPSRVYDNKLLMERDPSYVSRLYMSGSEKLVQAWLEGDWSAVEGAFFDCWDTKTHVIRPFKMPENWLRFRSFDWGSARPFSVGWWAIASDDWNGIPAGSMIRYREWYGAKGPNKGLKLTAEEVAEGILEREDDDEYITYGVADPSIFAEDGGPSHAERMGNRGVYWQKGDNKRISTEGAMGGWDQLRARFKTNTIYTFDTCKDSIRTIPVLQHSHKRPEDLDTDSEDHAADEWRYAAMSRPYATQERVEPKMAVDLWGRKKRSEQSWRTL